MTAVDSTINITETDVSQFAPAVLRMLLKDKTTGKNIIWATNDYASFGDGYAERDEMRPEALVGKTSLLIRPRVYKSRDEQQKRTKSKAEVFTPSWIVNKMNNHCDEEWFGRKNVFNIEKETSWDTVTIPVAFDEKKTWKAYVDSRRIEITCGEAPYVVSRYDTTTGDSISIENRIGILDRKMRVVNENSQNDEEWLKWAIRAFESTYGFEFQGDNLLLARMNVFVTFIEYYQNHFHKQPNAKLQQKIANIVCWNFWQMNGLTGTVPFGVPKTVKEEQTQITMFDFFDNVIEDQKEETTAICKIMDWRQERSISYDEITGGKQK